MEPQEAIDRMMDVVMDDLHNDLGAIAHGSALVVVEVLRETGQSGVAYISNVPKHRQVQLLAQALLAVSDEPTGTGEDQELHHG